MLFSITDCHQLEPESLVVLVFLKGNLAMHFELTYYY